MFLLVTGASGVGKSTVRTLIEAQFAPTLVCAELAEFAGTPQWSLNWRQQAVEASVRRALRLQRQGKHFLLCGDPVPPAELYAAPSAARIERIAVCLLDAAPEAQRARLVARGDDPALLPHHIAFATWMREHIAQPHARLEVVQQNGWAQMRWDRWLAVTEPAQGWQAHRIDTTDLAPAQVAAQVAAWVRERLET